MPLIEYTLFGTINKVELAIKRIQAFEPPEGYYLAFSGGKDSVCLLRLAEMAGVKYDAHYNLTTVDPPELVRFIREQHPGVSVERPENTMWDLIVQNGVPPTRLMRYCCKELKERGGTGRTVMTGIRWEESPNRAKRSMADFCTKVRKWYVHPILDWMEEDVWEFIRLENLPYCHLYDEGFTRLGCIMCPMGNTRQMERDAERWPKYYQAYLRAFDRMLQRRVEINNPFRLGSTAQEVMDWWIYGKKDGVPEEQIPMFV